MSRLGLGGVEQFFGDTALRRTRLIKIQPLGLASPILMTTGANAIEFLGETYQVALAVSLSSQSESMGDSEYDTDLDGAIDSDLLTTADLNNGVYRGAQVDEYIVDPQYPFAGPLRTYRYYLQDIRWDGEVFRATCGGIQQSVTRKTGDSYSRQCVVPLFSTHCGVRREDFRIPPVQPSTVTEVVGADRRQFKAQGFDVFVPTTQYNDYMIFGTLEFVTGDNAGRFGTIVQYNPNSETMVVAEGFPFDVNVGDSFYAYPGCQKTTDHCNGKFSNLPNFQGNPFVRTASGAVDAPSASS